MPNPGSLIWILFFSSTLGINAGSVRTLPHVIKYQTVRPQILNYSSLYHDAASQQTYPDVLQYSLTISGHNYTLHLEKNKDLVGKHFSVTHYSDQGERITTSPDDFRVHCYYHGHIVGMEDSSASVGLCSGIKGFVRLRDQMYLIEPLTEGQVDTDRHDNAPHAVYNYRHLRRKRSACLHGNTTTTFYDHGARNPAGLFKLGSLKSSRAQSKAWRVKPRTVELVVVVDNSEYKKFGSKRTVEARVMEVANHVDKLYRAEGVRVMLVGLDIWSYRDQISVSSKAEVTLARFLDWRQKSLVPRTKHDNAQFITGVDFEGSTVGLANTNSMCNSNSGAVNEDHNSNPIGVASTIAHEMGHNLGLSHDSEGCVCGSSTSKRGCIMAESVGSVFPERFSSCSGDQLGRFLEQVDPHCLLDSPPAERLYGGPRCGNAFLEPGEDCDCGTAEECKNPCCNATTCKLTAGAQCAEGECCHQCQLKALGSICRPSSGVCDLTEFCSGSSPSCPADAFSHNGQACNRGNGYCYNGRCPSRQEHCKRLWGPDAAVAADACFNQHGNCRKTLFSQRCSNRDQSCGTLFCSGGWEFPVTSRKSLKIVNGEMCNEATLKPEDNFPSDLGLVPTGTKCGQGMVCYNQRCQDMKSIQVYGPKDCSAKCNNRGVCNHEGKCHCSPGWAPPYCDVKQSELPEDAGVPVLAVSLAVGSLLLLVVVIGTVMCFIRKRRPAKRSFQSSSGQSNPVFRSSSTRGSPRLGNTHISRPIFLESSATQACLPLASAAVGPNPGALKPSRAAPQPPMKVPAVPQPAKIHQFVRPFMQPPPASSKPNYTEAKPLPPSRPLPPLSPKPTMKPKPPMPPVKPKPTAFPSPLPHTLLLAGRAALMPPGRPR